jgi:GNAT superfamily N-acetyltransferase
LDLTVIHDYLSHTSYWAQGRPFSVVQKAVENSLCFGVYRDDQQVGFARVVTDYATFAWLCDVFILEGYRGIGLGKWLIECVVAHPELQGLGLFLLATRDAHELYHCYGGFDSLQGAERWMVRGFSHNAGPD